LLAGVLLGAAASSAIWVAVWRRAAQDLAHEVRRPMTALVLAGEGLRSLLAAGEYDALTCQVQAASSMLGVSDPLSRFLTKLGRRSGGPGFQLGGVVSSSVAAWAPVARSAGRRIRLQDELPSLEIREPEALHGALSNLIANALEHGSGDISVSSVARPGGGWAIEVANDSLGCSGSGPEVHSVARRGRGERIASSEVRRLGGRLQRWSPHANLASLEFGQWKGLG